MRDREVFWENRDNDGCVTLRCWRIVLNSEPPINPEGLSEFLESNSGEFPPKTTGFERTFTYELRDSGKELACEIVDKVIQKYPRNI